LAPIDTKLLIALKSGRHLKANPGELRTLLPDEEESDAFAAFRRLYAEGHLKPVKTHAKGTWLRITDSGMKLADIAISERKDPTVLERLKSVPLSTWIALAALVVSIVALWKKN